MTTMHPLPDTTPLPDAGTGSRTDRLADGVPSPARWRYDSAVQAARALNAFRSGR